MVTIDEMKECIQEWMGQTRAAAELEAAQREEGQDGESAPTGARKPTTL